MTTGLSMLSSIVIYTKYAKYLPLQNRRETWTELVDRNKEMHLKKFPHMALQIEAAYKFVYSKKILPSMRSLQFAGPAIDANPARIFNCAYIPADDIAMFGETMFLLLSGCGVGFSVQNRHIAKLPLCVGPTGRTRKFLISDDIVGWADAVKMLMKSYLLNKPLPVFDFSAIREKGALLVTSGGKAPGPQPLKDCLHNIKSVLNRNIGKQLASIDVHDIICFIADAVLAGGIRRSATISLFDADDDAMLSSKAGNWWEANPQRGRANNSAIVDKHETTQSDFQALWDRVEASGSGEPGFVWRSDLEYGTNPCITGDTLVAVADGRNAVPIKDLVGTVYDVYAIEHGDVSIQKSLRTWKTKIDADIWRLVLDDDTVLRATADHRIMLFNGEYVELQDLEIGAKLMPFNYKVTVAPPMYNASNKNVRKVKSIVYDCIEDVYDMTVNNVHNFAVVTGLDDKKLSGIFIHNCGEIALLPNSFCNLCEVNVASVETQQDMEDRVEAAAVIGTLQASYTDFHYLRETWKETTEKDALIGVGLTGIATQSFLDMVDLKAAASIAVRTNKQVAIQIGINQAQRITTVKPAGSTSAVLKTSSGIHAWHAEYFLRRMRVSKNEALYGHMLAKFPMFVEDDKMDPNNTAIIGLPCKAPESGIIRSSEAPVDLLKRVRRFNTEWVRFGHIGGNEYNNVSATISIPNDKWEEVGEWMFDNRNAYCGLSVLPYDGGTYSQAPFEDITEEEYNELVQHCGEIGNISEEDDFTDHGSEAACSGDACSIL